HPGTAERRPRGARRSPGTARRTRVARAARPPPGGEPAVDGRDLPACTAGTARHHRRGGAGPRTVVDRPGSPRTARTPEHVRRRPEGHVLTDRGTVHVMAIADSDSYLKWAAGLLDALPEGWSGELAVVRTPIAPSPSQMRGAVQGTRNGMALPPVLSATALRRAVRRVRPDVVVAACTGPVVDVLVNDLFSGLSPRPVLVSGLPGVSVPATERAWLYRAPVDLFILHSHREVAEFRELGVRLGVTGEVGLATLPFLADGPAPGSDAPTIADPAEDAPRNRVVFATQAKVPVERAERESILRALADLAVRRPDLEVVVKLRARAHEQQ